MSKHSKDLKLEIVFKFFKMFFKTFFRFFIIKTFYHFFSILTFVSYKLSLKTAYLIDTFGVIVKQQWASSQKG